MAELPTSEENARKILEIFNRNNSRSGDTLMPGVFLAQARNVGLDIRDLEKALAHAGMMSWIENGNNNSIRLTDAGFREM